MVDVKQDFEHDLACPKKIFPLSKWNQDRWKGDTVVMDCVHVSDTDVAVSVAAEDGTWNL